MLHIRTALLKLAEAEPDIRAVVLPMTRQAEKWESMPKGWTNESREKFWGTLTGDNKHKVTKCIKEMEGKGGIDDPGAFCASLADRVMGSGWRKKKAFDKSNVPELLGQLKKVLLDKGLDETWEELRKCKAPQKVNDAWMSLSKNERKKKAARLASLRFKRAADIRKVLSQLFAGHANHLKDFGKFLKELAGDLPQWVDNWAGGELVLEGAEPAESGSYGWEGPQTGGYGFQGNQGFDPPEYAETDINVAGAVDISVSATLELRSFPREFAKSYRSLLSNERGFMQATADLLGNTAAVTMFGKLLTSGMDHYLKVHPDAPAEQFEDEIREVADEENELGWYITYELGSALFSKRPKFKVDGKGIKVWADGTVPVKVTEVEPPEPAYDNDGGRWARLEQLRITRLAADGGDFINSKTKGLAKRIFKSLKGLKATYDESPDVPSNAGGFIRALFDAKGNRSAARELHSFFGNMRGVGEGFGLRSELDSEARPYSRLNDGEAVAIGMLLLRSARRPTAAAAFEAWAKSHLNLDALDSTAETAAPQSPSAVFEADIKEQKGVVGGLFIQLGTGLVEAFCYRLAEDINWHSLNHTGLLGDGETEGAADADLVQKLVSKTSPRLDYSYEPAATLIVALFRKAKMRGQALAVKRYVLKEFPESFEATD